MPIEGRPFLDYVLDRLADAGLTSVGLVVGPGADPVRTHYAAVRHAASPSTSSCRREPRGTAERGAGGTGVGW